MTVAAISEKESSCPMDKIFIKDLLARCDLGVCDEERRERQDVLINVVLSVDLAPAGASDELSDSVDYRALKKRVLVAAETSSFRLAEALAEHLAAICLEDERVAEVQVSVEKPTALRFARTVSVEITRQRPS